MSKRPSVPAKPSVPVDVALFDTYSVVFRAFHALPRLTTSTGVPSSALYGFSSLVLKVLRESAPRALSFAVDAPKRTFRKERFPDYKAGRAATPSELVQQLERLPALLEAFEALVFCVPGYEADDLLATLARRLTATGKSVLIVSGDRDLLQTVGERTRVLFLGRRGQDGELYDTARVEERFGVPPGRLPAYRALVGDPSDNLQGVPGIGPRTAAELVTQFGSMRELTENVERIGSERTRESVRASSERLLLNEELGRLCDEVPLESDVLAAPLTARAGDRLRRLFAELEFKSLLTRLERLELAGT
jgi:DNA polymerase-1